MIRSAPTQLGEVETLLRDGRPEPGDALVDQIVARARHRDQIRADRARPALAFAATVALLVVAAALGGIGDAAAAAKEAAAAVAQAIAPAAAPSPAAGKVTICHATGSSSNPYVEITISSNGLKGHDGHTGDVVPAPPLGCPGPTPGQDQYRPGKGCGDRNHVHARSAQCKPRP